MPNAQNTGRHPRGDEVLHADLPREPGHVHRSGAAGRDEREVPRIASSLAEHDVDGAGHLGVHHVVDGGGGFRHRQPQRVRPPWP